MATNHKQSSPWQKVLKTVFPHKCSLESQAVEKLLLWQTSLKRCNVPHWSLLTTKPWRLNFATSLGSFSLTTELSFLFLTTTIINPKHTSLALTLTLKRNLKSTTRLTNSVTPPPVHFARERTSSLWRQSVAYMVLAHPLTTIHKPYLCVKATRLTEMIY